jgi:hypothetical protein
MPSPMKLYRCLNSKCPAKSRKPAVRDFEAEKPICPTCTAGRDDSRAVKEIQYCHFLVNVPLATAPIRTASGGRQVACSPTSKRIPKHATGVARVATCPRCQATAIFKQHLADGTDQHFPLVEQVMRGQSTPIKNITRGRR